MPHFDWEPKDFPLQLELSDTVWPLTRIDHSRVIARALVLDDQGRLYFNSVSRDDLFGKGEFIETAGGGVEDGESLERALRRELEEELGVLVRDLVPLAFVEDTYHAIHRRNLNFYFLCRIQAFVPQKLTKEEQEKFQLRPLRLSYQEALAAYQAQKEGGWGQLLYQREYPLLIYLKEKGYLH